MRFLKQSLIEKGLSARRESKYVEFKESFDVDSAADWCELLKDIIALINSGGGILLIGLKNDGIPSSFDCSKIIQLDPAIITDKIYKYTNRTFQEFEIEPVIKDKMKIAAIILYGVKIPIVFCKPGTYAIDDKKQRTSFSMGTIYFRHGAKSEPCDSNDLTEVIERNIEEIKKSWLGNIRKVVEAPVNSAFEVHSPKVVVTNNATATPIRITNDETAPIYKLEDPNSTHPYRGKEILSILQNDLNIRLTSFHIQCLRREYKIDESRPDFYYKPKFATPQFSILFLDWLKELYKNDKQIFDKIREKNLKH